MTQKETIEKLALYLAKYHTTLDVTSFMYEASVTFLRMVNERACANVIVNGRWGGSKPWFEFPNQTAIQDTIALIEQFEE